MRNWRHSGPPRRSHVLGGDLEEFPAIRYAHSLRSATSDSGLFPVDLSLEAADVILNQVVFDALQESLAPSGDGPRDGLGLPRFEVGVGGDHAISVEVHECIHVAVASEFCCHPFEPAEDLLIRQSGALGQQPLQRSQRQFGDEVQAIDDAIGRSA